MYVHFVQGSRFMYWSLPSPYMKSKLQKQPIFNSLFDVRSRKPIHWHAHLFIQRTFSPILSCWSCMCFSPDCFLNEPQCRAANERSFTDINIKASCKSLFNLREVRKWSNKSFGGFCYIKLHKYYKWTSKIQKNASYGHFF